MAGYPPVFMIGIACALAGAGVIGWKLAPEPPSDSGGRPVSLVSAQPAAATVRIPICGSGKRITCVVDGDTIWYQGEKIRLEGFNAPEVQGACNRETTLARKATERLRAILSAQPFTISRNGKDRYGRTLATIRNSHGDIGRAMIAEGLAHEWRGFKESWCE